ncbi:MAG: hypothetical protein ACLFTP_01730 [Rhodosalinus sp.]|uniref:hypothetical protein n=1 Tax=Rhodosalinus sp. TaxID=2047741 RepID=UPI00397BA17A
MSKDKKPQLHDPEQMLRMMSQLPAPTAFMAPQAQIAWSTQKALMDEWERYAHAWFERRREAAESAQRCMERVQNTGSPDSAQANEAMREMNAWLTDEMQRLTADAMENTEFCLRCFGILTQGATSAGTELAKETEQTAGEATKAAAARAKTTPV